MSRLLISVASADEAHLALTYGAEIIDGKDAAAGPLAALPEATLREIVARVAGRVPVSATVGDWPADPPILLRAAERIAATGVDWVKIGLYPGGDWAACLHALTPFAQCHALVVLLFADRTPDPASFIPEIAAAGCRGVMLDTADKQAGGLRNHIDDRKLACFIAAARQHGLQCGLAGSLSVDDAAALAKLGADVLGFRGAACQGGTRAATLCTERVVALREALDETLPAT